jgi:hypothetical protein
VIGYLGQFVRGKLVVPWLRWIVASLSLWRHRFTPWLVFVGFMVDKVAMRQVFYEIFGFPVSIIPPWLFIYHLRDVQLGLLVPQFT